MKESAILEHVVKILKSGLKTEDPVLKDDYIGTACRLLIKTKKQKTGRKGNKHLVFN